MTAEEILVRLKALEAYEITKYKSMPGKEVVEYQKCPEFGRFMLAWDVKKLIKEIEASAAVIEASSSQP